ncbi:MAG: SdpI family protein [Terracidiphilus sp.]|jgi:uncharacterized membrane protein
MTRKVLVFELLLIAAVLVVTALLYPRLPAQIPTHWNVHLQPDHYMSGWTTFLLGPGLLAGITLITFLLPWLSPRDFQVDGFRATYRQVMLIFFNLWIYLYAAILWAAFGHPLDAGRAIAVGYCLGFVFFGNVMGKVRRNFFIGVRTPWTLTNERVWNATHRFAAKAWVAAGLLGLVSEIFGLHVGPAIALLIGWLGPKLYSLVVYKRLERRGEIGDGLPREAGES